MTADRPFESAFPRLIESFNDVDVEILTLAEREHILDDPCLVHRRWQRAFTHAAGARPADFADENLLAWKRVDDLPANSIDMRSGPAGGNWKILPIGQYMDGDKIDGIGDVAVAQPELPDVGIGHGHPDACLDRPDRPREVGRGLDLVVVFRGMAGQP